MKLLILDLDVYVILFALISNEIGVFFCLVYTHHFNKSTLSFTQICGVFYSASHPINGGPERHLFQIV